MKKTAPAVLLCLALLLLCGCGRQQGRCRLILAADLHYIAPSLQDGGPAFLQVLEEGDGKLSLWSEELWAAFVRQVLSERPDAVLLLGDLSFNGALDSHRALAEKLGALEAAGITVLVTTGNHDLDNPNAAAFSGESWRRVPSASAEDFERLYAAFGYEQALSRDTDSLSYLYALNDDCRLLVLDLNTPHDPCGLSDKTLLWIEEQLRQARQQGKLVLAAGHQNLFQQTLFRDGYVIRGADELLTLLQRYQIPLYLSGHLHVQHSMTCDGVTEIAGSALSVWPCQFGLLRAENGGLRYETQKLRVSDWAKEQGRTEPELMDFDSTAAAVFDRRSQTQLSPLLADLTPESRAAVIRAFCRVNRAYFSGNLRSWAELDPDGVLVLLERRDPLYALYLNSVVGDLGKDFTSWIG